MSQSVAKVLFQELLKHQKYAARLQVQAVQKSEQARQALAKRGGAIAEAAATEKYEVKPLEPKVTDSYKLDQIRNEDVQEIVDYLKHQRKYKELLERYSSGPEDTLERVNATAKRVGLDATKL